jgi:hypothetical protein
VYYLLAPVKTSLQRCIKRQAMKISNTLIVHPSAENFDALVAFMTALKIKFEVPKGNSPYKEDFVTMVQQGDKDLKNGKGKKISIDDLDQLWK